jgi:ELWxxDGT repeat protein
LSRQARPTRKWAHFWNESELISFGIVHRAPIDADSSLKPLFEKEVFMSYRLVFAADNGALGTELWVSDGSAAGTTLVKDSIAGPGGSGVDELTAVGGLLFFRATTAGHGSELWLTDGTEAGTVRVSDIAPAGQAARRSSWVCLM